MALTAIVTAAGRAALVNASNTGTAPVTIAQVGVSGTAVVPTPAMTALPGETKRIATLSGDVVADDTIHLIVRDESTDIFTVRSFGLYLADGTLFAIYGQAPVILEKSAQAMMLLAIDVRFADVSAAMLTFGDANFLNPPATTEMQGVVELATDAESEEGTDTQRAVTPKGMKSAVTNWLNSRFGNGAPSNFVKELLTSASAAAMRLALGLKSAALKDEGAGNNLDADMLDGQHGAYYSNITARLGYVPWGPTNDGAGSGLDADLLDGLDSSYFTNIPARLGFTPVQQGGGVGQLGNAVKIGWSGSRLKVTVDASDQGNLVFDAHIADVWRASNDGAGSGLDADLLDGQQGSFYADVVGRLGYTPLNATAYSAADVKAKLLTVDGSGSGVDADLVDGWHRDDIRHWDNLLGKPWNWSGQGGQPSWLWGGNANGAFYVYNPSNFSVAYAAGAGNADTVDGYHASQFFGPHNDGSGSGVDADLLDGQHRSQIQCSGDLGANHWYVDKPLANGQTMRETGGSTALGANTSTVVMLERPLASIRHLRAQPIRTQSGDEGNCYCQREGAFTDRVRVINGLGAATTVEWSVLGTI